MVEAPVAGSGLIWQTAGVLLERRNQCQGLRGYSAATATTATTRGAAQIDCAAFGEHELNADWHARHGTH
jgi:hypothetical protein